MKTNVRRYKTTALLLGLMMGGVASAALASGASSASETGYSASQSYIFDMPELATDKTLLKLARTAGIEIIFSPTLTGQYNSPSFQGNYSIEEALSIILSNSDLTFKRSKAGVYTVMENAGFQRVGYNTPADYEANLGVYAADEEADDVNAFELDEIIVTASRRSQKLQDVAMSMATVDPEKFIAAGLTSIEEVIQYTPGVNIQTEGISGSGSIAVRGVVQAGSIPVTAVYIDDVPVTSSTPFAAGGALFFDGLLGDLERVEIIKGPQGTLYGASSMGGLVRYISKDPALEETRGSASVDISTTKEGGVSQLYRAMVSTPLVEDKIGLTVSGFYNDEAGFIDRLDPATLSVAEEDYNSAETYGISVSGLWKISEDTSVKLSGLYQKTERLGRSLTRFTFADEDNIVLDPDAGRYEVIENDPGFDDLIYKKADMTIKHAFEWGEFVSVTGYAKYSSPAVVDLVSDLGVLLSGFFPDPIETIPFTQTVGSEKFLQELRLSSSNNDTFEWQVGLFYTKDETDNAQFGTVEPQGIVIIDATFPSDYEEKAAFANVTYYLTPNLDVTAGVRYSDTSLDAVFDFGGLLVPPLDDTTSVDDDVLTYLFNARWRVKDSLSLYARVASGYRPAWTSVPITDVNTGITSSSVIEADSLWSYEIGAKGSAFDGKFNYDIALWAIDWAEFQTLIMVNGASTGANSDVDSSSYGFEGTFNAVMTDQLRLQATVAYAKSTIGGDSVAIGAADGERTPNLPDWTASIQAIYDYTIGSDIDASVNLGARYVGTYTTDYLGYPNDPSRGIGGFERNFPVEDVTIVDLSANFTKGNLSLTLYATNLFDNYAFNSGNVTLAGDGTGVADASVIKPRTIGASLGFSF